jgi:hypothetical protein
MRTMMDPWEKWPMPKKSFLEEKTAAKSPFFSPSVPLAMAPENIQWCFRRRDTSLPFCNTILG